MNITSLTPWSTAARYADAFESWLSPYDQQRIAAYQVYEDVYWGQVGLLKSAASNDDPIQVPVARSIIEAVVRYLAVEWDLYVDPSYGDSAQRQACDREFRRLFRRENFWSKFAAQKRWGLVKGDAVWHITADPTKAPGTRISLHVVDPATYFPYTDPGNQERVLAVYLAEPVEVDGKTVIRRQAYRKVIADDGTTTITSESAYYQADGWDDRDGGETKLLQVLDPVQVLEGVTQLPVYRVPNTVNPGDPYGSSLLRGLERVLRGIDQTITDEDLAVALAGLGFYVTDSEAPKNPDGTDADGWHLSPLNVQEMGKNFKGEAATFKRVDGVSTIAPSQEHSAYLEGKAASGASVPSVALGSVDAATAESGIALFLRLSPLLAANREREDVMLGVYDQMFHDLQHDWYPAFEAVSFPDCVVSSVVGDPMPTNRDAKVQEVLTLATSTPPLITLDEARAELTKLGWQFGNQGANAIMAQVLRQAQANDPFSGRINEAAEDQSATPAS